MPDMREKVKEYIQELEDEINRCVKWVENEVGKRFDVDEYGCWVMKSRIETLIEVKNDLVSRLEELV